MRIGVIGLGYWGPNLVRCFKSVPDCEVTIVCDRDESRLVEMQSLFPDVKTTLFDHDVLSRQVVDAVVIATPTRTHYALAKTALDEGLHTFVEKPLATSSWECRDLIDRARQSERILFVGHVFLYSAAVGKLKELVQNGELGDVCYLSASRLNLGPVRQDVSALWDLAPHDISIFLDVLKQIPVEVSCSGLAYLSDDLHDVCNLTLHFANRCLGIVHVSWLNPRKTREMTIVGNKKMAIYDDIEPLEKIKVYDNGVHPQPYPSTFGEFQFSYRYGDTYSPHLQQVEPLKAQAENFVRCALSGDTPTTDGSNGLHVVRVIEAAERSLLNNGARVALETDETIQPDTIAPAIANSYTTVASS